MTATPTVAADENAPTAAAPAGSVAPEPEHDDDAEQPDNHRLAEVVTEHPDDQRITHRRSPRR